jgi:hypothetical protein
MTSITSMTSGQARGCVEESSVMEAMTSGPQARMEAMEAMGGDYPVARAAYCAASVPAVQDRAEWTASDRHLRVHLVLPVSAAAALLFQADGVLFALHLPSPLRMLGESGPMHVPKFKHGGEAGGKASDIATSGFESEMRSHGLSSEVPAQDFRMACLGPGWDTRRHGGNGG